MILIWWARIGCVFDVIIYFSICKYDAMLNVVIVTDKSYTINW